MSLDSSGASDLSIAGLGSANSVPVSRQRHARWRWLQPRNLAFARTLDAVVVVKPEVEAAAAALPLAFILEAGVPELVAVLHSPGAPHIVDDGQNWTTSYVPSLLRAWPFSLSTLADGATELRVADPSPLVTQEAEGERFFEDDGRPGTEMARVIQFFGNWDASRRATRTASMALAALDLLQPSRESWGEAGLLHVDRARLEALDDAAFLSLRRQGALGVAHAQLLSLQHLRPVKRQARPAAATPKPAALSSFLDALVASQDDEGGVY